MAAHGVVTIRPYRPDDLDATVALWHRTWAATFPDLRHPQPLPAWTARFLDEILPRRQVWIAEDAGTIAGFMAVDVAQGYLDQLFVDPGCVSHGTGTALLEQAKRLCPRGLRLHTLQCNARARAFWKRHGFTPGATSTNAVNGQPNVEYRWQP